MTPATWGLVFLLFSGCTWIPLSTVHPISVGDIEFDPPTIHTVGISLPALSGDENYDAAVRVFYRVAGGSSWEEALPLQRVRPDTLSRAVPSAFAIAEQFAGSIFDLAPDSAYEIRLRIEDPEGGITTRTAWAVTRAVPRTTPRSPHIVDVDSDDALAKALARAAPGDVITLDRGLYKGFRTSTTTIPANDPTWARSNEAATLRRMESVGVIRVLSSGPGRHSPRLW